MNELHHYISAFSSLHTNKQKGVRAPHKAVLLMAVIDLVEEGRIDSPRIPLSEELVNRFFEIWNRYIGGSAVFTPDIAKPFYHMQHEPFLMLVSKSDAETTIAAEDEPTISGHKTLKDLPRGSYSVNAMREAFAFAEIDNQLFTLLQNNDARAVLRVTLINNYFTNHPTKSMPNLKDLLLALPLLAIVA